MNILKVSILSIIQGITEILPISSSAHLLLTSQLLNVEMDTYLLSVLHLGTTIALCIYFSSLLFKDIFKKEKLSLYVKILISTIPAGILGLFFESIIEEKLRGNIIIAASLIIWGIVMIIIEGRKEPKEIDFKDISWKQSLTMGVSQIIAFIPGGSRSGISTMAGMLMGLNKYTSIQYSFLLGLPLLLAAPFYEMLKGYPERVPSLYEIFGIVIAGIISYIGLILLKKISKKKWLTFFGMYRIVLGVSIIFLEIL
ncbi:MAG TPA: undecaprenyl-diphosphate phosphatase [Candidatus Dojkabacteria bacterium]|nr:undecaprenyl-diphosphate phosphatase [Candidatus Dojkabacteria bacterium]